MLFPCEQETCTKYHQSSKRTGFWYANWALTTWAVSSHITYAELHEKVCRMANVLKARGVKKGDRVILYMPMIPEAAYAMLACARIGAVHSIVFGGFSPDALASRIEDCEATFVTLTCFALRTCVSPFQVHWKLTHLSGTHGSLDN